VASIAKIVVVDQILVAERHAEHALPLERRKLMPDRTSWVVATSYFGQGIEGKRPSVARESSTTYQLC
jgi:hypothetical protein